MQILQPDDLELIIATLKFHFYEYTKIIGQGGYGSVHLIRSVGYSCSFVAKIVEQSRVKQDEISAMLSLTHPNIISMYEYFTDTKFMYMILEYCPGDSLSTFIKKKNFVPVPDLYYLCAKLLLAIKECHDNNIAHRDIKPGNILIDSNGRPKLVDFGLCMNSLEKGQLVNNFCGSKKYMAPEIIKKVPYDPKKSDVWTLGITFFVLATGKSPWDESNQSDIPIVLGVISYSEIRAHQDFIKIIRDMLQVNPNKRASIDEILVKPFLKPYLSTLSLQESSAVTNNMSATNVRRITFDRSRRYSVALIQHINEEKDTIESSKSERGNPVTLSFETRLQMNRPKIRKSFSKCLENNHPTFIC
ncbi:CAMK family protein kinase [Tritrichomonas foetus]|uniref:CAMK family protein kinase n=1 Tax=Tritrichomonas foetus TaxID=1144522 RepID=A0A1J4JC55_9EUKA|nr:CAMK family protein kinase [Tritrichomonas foetus]|eukprot:OHS96766.1 CAMK family protein kinase [Tritrichomonas foetus]